MKLADGSYLTTPAFVVNDIEDGGLGLKGNEATVFAVIWGFSQDGKTWFTGTQAYIAQWCGATTRTVRNVIESLTSKGLIEKREHTQKGVVFCDYRVSDKVAQFSTLRKNFPHPQEKFSDTYNNPYSNNPSDIDSNESISSPPKGKSASFVAPSIDDVLAYCAEHEFSIDPYEFFDHYQGNGWMAGKVKMKDWKATLRNWERRKRKGESYR